MLHELVENQKPRDLYPTLQALSDECKEFRRHHSQSEIDTHYKEVENRLINQGILTDLAVVHELKQANSREDGMEDLQFQKMLRNALQAKYQELRNEDTNDAGWFRRYIEFHRNEEGVTHSDLEKYLNRRGVVVPGAGPTAWGVVGGGHR